MSAHAIYNEEVFRYLQTHSMGKVVLRLNSDNLKEKSPLSPFLTIIEREASLHSAPFELKEL